MSISHYLWTVAEDLQVRVAPSLTDRSARDTLTNSIRILTTIASALESDGADGAAPDTDRLAGPPENAAARRADAARIAAVAQALDADASAWSARRGEIAWEKDRLDAAMAAIDAVEQAPPAAGDDDGPVIDRAALELYLQRRFDLPGLAIAGFDPVRGGRSRQTVLFSVEGGGALPAGLVIQRTLPGMAQNARYASDEGQFRTLDYLHRAGMRVPRPVLVETDAAILGAPFILTEQVSGAPIQPDYWAAAGPPDLAIQLARQMAILHRLPWQPLAASLPQSVGEWSAAQWLDDWEQTAAGWHRLAHWPSITISAALAWMRDNLDCIEDRRSLVHNDMIFHNILADDGAITAVVDWEQASVGHPAEDLGYCYPAVCRAADWGDFMAAYVAAGGEPFAQRQIDFFALRSALRMLNLAVDRGRDAFERRGATGVLVASAGAHWTQRFLHRIAGTLASIVARSG